MAGDNIRKWGIILVVAVLFSIFVFSLGDAVTPEPNYPDFCPGEERYYPEPRPLEEPNCTELPQPTQAQIDACPGTLHERYSGGCPVEWQCNCEELRQDYRTQEATIQFWIAIVLGFIAIVAGMLLPTKNELNEWIGGGFIFGGLITLFIATAQYWSEIDKILRPIVILLELVLVLWIAYRRFSKKK